MTAISWQEKLHIELLLNASYYKRERGGTLEEAIQQTAQILITSRETTLRTYTSLSSLSIQRLNPEQTLDVNLLKQQVSKREDALVEEDEDGFLLVDDLQVRSRKELKLLRAWEKDPSACVNWTPS